MDELQHLRLARRRVANHQHIDVTSEVVGPQGLVASSEQLTEDPPLDILP